MGILTLADYRTDLDAGLQRTVNNTLKDRWVNQAQKEFGYAFRFHELENVSTLATVAGNNAIPFSTIGGVGVARYIEEVRKTAPFDRLGRLLPETRSQYLKKIGDLTDSTQRGDPRYWHKFGNNIYLRPVPDATPVTLDFQYYGRVTNLVAPADASLFHEDWDEAIYLGALYRGFRHFGEFDRYQNVRADFLGFVRSRQTEYELEEFPEGGISPLGPTDSEGTLIT